MLKQIISLYLFVAGSAIFLLCTGCGDTQPLEIKGQTERIASPLVSGHSHGGMHGGMVEAIGDSHAEMVFDPKNDTVTIYVSDLNENSLPIEISPLTVQAKAEGAGNFVKVVLTAIPQSGDPAGKSSRFTGGHADLAGVKNFVAVARIPVGKDLFRAMYHFSPAKNPVFVCPMDCEKGKAYITPGKCPVCGMDMVVQSMAHSDHSPKHGGLFFMDSDQWHHLEGVLISATEFRVYIYNNFTRPMAVSSMAKGSSIEIAGVSGNIPFTSSADNAYLMAILPATNFPISISAKILFEGQSQPSLFGFTFDTLSNFH